MKPIELMKILITLMDKMHIGVIHGGDANEGQTVLYKTRNPRGEKNYKAVAEDIAEALRNIGFRHVSLYPEDINLLTRLREDGVHFAWLNSGGTQGYAATCHAPSLLELMGVPYVGHNPLNAGLLDNKHAFKHFLRGLNIDTGRFLTWDSSRGDFKPRINSHFKHTFGDYPGPFVIKPISGRASLNIKVVDTVDELTSGVAEVHRLTENIVMIEEYIGGREFCVAIMGPWVSRGGGLSRQARAFSFSAIERVLDNDEVIFTSMDQRPITIDRVRILDSANESVTYSFLDTLAQRVYLDCSLEAPVRLDVRADDDGRLFVLEANPKPDLRRPRDGVLSLICAGLEQEGMDYEDLILSILANRLDYLFTNRGGTVQHILDLVA
jgi:D-alanine-D-alanine ligase